jgi:hypothetical protein
MAISDPVVMPLARELLDCYAVELAKVEPAVQHVALRPGTVVDFLLSRTRDECCEGLGWVRPAGFYPSSGTFPSQDETPVGDPPGTRAWAITLELGAARCAPVKDGNSIPSNDEWDRVTQEVMDDAAAIRRAICCFIDAQPGRKKRVLPGLWQPLAVQGGCVGGILPITILGPACDCPDAGEGSS